MFTHLTQNTHPVDVTAQIGLKKGFQTGYAVQMFSSASD